MENSYTDGIMRKYLTEIGFDFNHPEPLKAWKAFKLFSIEEIPTVKTIAIGFEIQQYSDRDDILWLSYMRQFEDNMGVGWSSGCLLSTKSPEELKGLSKSNWWWAEFGIIEDWFTIVEVTYIHKQCFQLKNWVWEGFSE